MIRTYWSRFLLPLVNDPDTKNVAQEFKKYKTDGDRGTLFGRDAEFARPESARMANLWHTHLLNTADIKRSVNKKGVRSVHFLSQSDLTSDACLIYCQGMGNPNNYLLLDIIWRGAHEKTRNMNTMISYAQEAERFYSSGK